MISDNTSYGVFPLKLKSNANKILNNEDQIGQICISRPSENDTKVPAAALKTHLNSMWTVHKRPDKHQQKKLINDSWPTLIC